MNEPIPTAGAVDLAAFKRDETGGNLAAQKIELVKGLRASGFICECGAQVAGDGILALGWLLGQFPTMTPQGVVVRDGAEIIARHYHSRECPAFQAALAHGLETAPGLPRVQVGLVRDMPPTEWLIDPR